MHAGHPLDELPRLVRLVRLGVDQHVPPAERAGEAVAGRHWERGNPDLLGLNFRVVLSARERVHVGPVAREDRLSAQEDRVRRRLLGGGHGLRRDAVLYQVLLRGQAVYRLGAVYDHLIGVVRVEYVAAVGPDVLEAVAHPALVLVSLEDEGVFDALILRRLHAHLCKLVPGLGGFGIARFLQEIRPVVKYTGVRVPRHAVDLAVVHEGLYGPGQELRLLALWEPVGDVQEPTVGGELGWPDHVRAHDVYVAAAGLELGPELVEVLV